MVYRDMTKGGRASTAFYEQIFTDFRDMPDYPYISDGKAVFFAGFAGGRSNWDRAQEYAEEHDLIRVGDTRPGKILEGFTDRELLQEYFGDDLVNDIWDCASQSYAATAEGDVKTFAAGARHLSIFRRLEMPMFLHNEKVDSINGVPRQEFKDFLDQTINTLRGTGLNKAKAIQVGYNEVFRAIVLAEIRQDLRVARDLGDDDLKADAFQRLSTHREKWKAEDSAKKYIANPVGEFANMEVDFRELGLPHGDIIVEAIKNAPERVQQGHWDSGIDQEYDS